MATKPPDTLVVLAGGLGTRLRSVVPDLAKPMAPVAGKPFLEYLLRRWVRLGIERFVLSVGFKHETITNYFGESFEGVPITYVIEHSPAGTGGGLLLSAAEVEGNFFALNGDTFFDVDVAEMVRIHEAHTADWTFALFRSEDKERYMSVSVDGQGFIRAFGQAPDTASFLVNGGVYLIRKAAIDHLSVSQAPLSLESELLPSLLSSGARMLGVEQKGSFIDIGVPGDYARAAATILRG